jgi:hypothetical protein
VTKPATPVRIPSRISSELHDRIEAWMATQPVRPSKTATIEYLLDLGLKAAGRSRNDR